MQKLSSPIDIIKRSWNIFFQKDNLKYYLSVTWPIIPVSLLSISSSLYTKQLKNPDPSLALDFFSRYGWLIGVMIVLGIAGLIVSFWVGSSAILATVEVVSGRRNSPKELYKASWKRLGAFALLGILGGLIILGGFILLIIPGIVFSVWLHFSNLEFWTKGKGIMESIKGSRALVSGRFWPVFGRIIVLGLFYVLGQFLLSLIPYGVGTLLFALLAPLFATLPVYLLYQELNAA